MIHLFDTGEGFGTYSFIMIFQGHRRLDEFADFIWGDNRVSAGYSIEQLLN